VTFDLNISPLYRINGQEAASLPGLLAVTPPRKFARGRDHDRLVVYLLLTGNASFSSAEYMQLAGGAAAAFYQTGGALTSAMRFAAESLNRLLLERNMSTSRRGQYAVGWLALGALREAQLTLLLSGPIHAYLFGGDETRHIFEPALSDKGLGLGQTAPYHFTQAALQAGERILLCGKTPQAWEQAFADRSPASLEVMRRKLVTVTNEDLHAVLMQTTEGNGAINFLQAARPTPLASTPQLPRRASAEAQPEEAATQAHVVQPSAYAIPPQPQAETFTPLTENLTAPESGQEREFPPSIPRAKLQTKTEKVEPAAQADLPTPSDKKQPPKSARQPSQRTRQTAKIAARGIQSLRQGSERFGAGLQKFLPRLLPGNESGESAAPPAHLMLFLAVLVPLIVVTVASIVYFRYGRSPQCEAYLQQAQNARAQALILTDAAMQRDAWHSVYQFADNAEACRKTSEGAALKQEAEARLDQLLGILRLRFNPLFSSKLNIKISRMAASETDLFLLDAQKGEVTRAMLTNHGFEVDAVFNCKPGPYSGYQVGPLVDILALPLLNSVNATLLGVDTNGNLLYCAPGQVPQAIPLPPPDTNWKRVAGIALDGGNLYVMDADSRAVWVYPGKDGAFVDRPYFFFGGQIPEITDAIDLAVSGDDLYILHSDGHLSVCSYSRIEAVPTRCQDPAVLTNPFAAQDADFFKRAHITQMMFSAPPDQAILLLDADNQSVLRLTPRSLELQNQLRPTTGSDNPIPPGRISAMAAGPNHVLYLATEDQVYFSTDLP
jgi:hypothetical protein